MALDGVQVQVVVAVVVQKGPAGSHDLGLTSLAARMHVDARRAGLDQTGLRNLAGLLLGFRIPKGNRTSNWAARQLSPAQINYAATDAWVCRELFLRFETMGLLPATAFPA